MSSLSDWTKAVRFNGNPRYFIRGVAICNNNKGNQRLKGVRIYAAKVWATEERVDGLTSSEAEDHPNCSTWDNPVYCPANNVASAVVVHHNGGRLPVWRCAAGASSTDFTHVQIEREKAPWRERRIQRREAMIASPTTAAVAAARARLFEKRPTAQRLDRLIAEQERVFLDRQPESARLHARAVASLAGGVTSSWQITRPQPIWIREGKGSRVWDVDGNEYVDFHGGYGVGLAGHAHPAIVEAVSRRVTRGTHFAQPSPDAPVVAEELARRFGLPLWRFSNSGTEATMSAVHLARSLTGRNGIVKFAGAYHGHHDSVRMSIWHDPTLAHRPDGRLMLTRASSGIPASMRALTRVVPFNDLHAVAEILDEHGADIACVIVEPIMMNCGIIYPLPGFLEGLRGLTRRHGTLLIYDEIKTGLTAHPGGATQLFGVEPDLVCLAKALGGGIPTGAIGGTTEVMEEIVSGRYEQVGTMNGNPLSMAAARAMLLEVLTPEAYGHVQRLEGGMSAGARRIVAKYGLTGQVVSAGAKGSIAYSARPLRNYEDFSALDGRHAYCAWLIQHNGGVFLPPWSKGEQWLISVQHTEEDVDRYLTTLERFAMALSG